MANNCGPTIHDPIRGLIEYVTTVKPFHTKILEATVEYVQVEPVIVYVQERLLFDINISEPQADQTFDCLGGYGILWDSPGGNVSSKQAIQTITISPTTDPTDPTGLIPLNTYTFIIVINGNPYTISILGANAPTYGFTPPVFDPNTLLTQINAQLQLIPFPDTAYVAFDGNDFSFQTLATGSAVTLYIIDETPTNPLFLFSNLLLTSYVFNIPSAGEDFGTPSPTFNVIDADTKRYRITVQGNQVGVFLPGTKIQWFNSDAKNNGCYSVYSATFDGTNTVLQVMQKVYVKKPLSQLFFGYITLANVGYSDDFYCYPTCQDPLDVYGFVTESLTFSWGTDGEDGILELEDVMVGAVDETAQAVVPTNEGQSLLPDSLDGPALDMGGLDENIGTVIVLYGQTV